jgi:hypothetical protein
MDDYKTIDKVIAYEREQFPVKCSNPNDIKTEVVNKDKSITTKCTKFIKFLGEPDDQHKDECPVGSTVLLSQNMCIAQQYDAICQDGLDKIGNNCYKPCNNNYITVDIKRVNDYTQLNNGDKCVNNNLKK